MNLQDRHQETVMALRQAQGEAANAQAKVHRLEGQLLLLQEQMQPEPPTAPAAPPAASPKPNRAERRRAAANGNDQPTA